MGSLGELVVTGEVVMGYKMRWGDWDLARASSVSLNDFLWIDVVFCEVVGCSSCYSG